MIKPIDHLIHGIGRLVTQFKDSPNLKAYIETLLVEANTLEEVLAEIITSRWLETAEGKQLDIIGSIVGQSRVFIDADAFKFFGFYDYHQAITFGTLSDPTAGGRFIAEGEITTGFRILTDAEYRAFIRARIVRNNTASTPEEIIAQLKFVLDAPLILFRDGNTFYEISVGRKLTPNETILLTQTDIVPKTAGVKVIYYSEFNAGEAFSFEGVPLSKSFGSLADPLLGGPLSSLLDNILI